MQSLCRRLAVRASSRCASRYPSSSLFPRSALREHSRRTLFTERRGGILGFLSESVTAKVLIGMLIGVGSGLFLPDLLDYIREDVLREREAYMKVEVQAEVTDRVFLDITVDDNYYGRIVIGLYGKECPKTVKNFISIAEGFEIGEDSSNISKIDSNNSSNSSSDNNSSSSNVISNSSNSNSSSSSSNSINEKGDTPPVRLQYKGTSFFKIVPSFCLIGGDVINDDGTGGACIYKDSSPDSNNGAPNSSNNSKINSNSSSSSKSKDAESLKDSKVRRPYSSFDDESCPNLKHLGLGVVSAAKNNDEGTNSKFFISVRPFPHLDDRNVVFGHVLSGYELILQLEKFGQRSGTPKQDVRIGDCGLLPRNLEHKSEV